MFKWYLVVQLFLAGAPGPNIYIPMDSKEDCMKRGGQIAVDLVENAGHAPVFRTRHRCVKIAGA